MGLLWEEIEAQSPEEIRCRLLVFDERQPAQVEVLVVLPMLVRAVRRGECIVRS
jgi:hypothetical protein